MDSIKPIFITGIYRSGTTLISRILDNHPELNVTYDSVHFMRFSYDKFNPIQDESNYSNLVKEIENRIKSRWKLNLDVKKILNKINNGPVDYAQIYNAIMSNLIKNSTNRWGEKTNVCWRKIPYFLQMFPNGKTIIIIRDPRDVLVSYKNMTTEPGLRYLDSVFASLDTFQHIIEYNKEISSKKFHLIKYEELVSEPELIIKKVCEFLEIEFDPIMLESSQFKDKGGNTWKANTSFDTKIEGISNNTIGRWKNRISNVELYFVEMVLRDQMINFGYELAANPLSKKEWDELFEILNDDFIKRRYSEWIKTGKGHQKYPNE